MTTQLCLLGCSLAYSIIKCEGQTEYKTTLCHVMKTTVLNQYSPHTHTYIHTRWQTRYIGVILQCLVVISVS